MKNIIREMMNKQKTIGNVENHKRNEEKSKKKLEIHKII